MNPRQQEQRRMHPEAFAAGVEAERERVVLHAELGRLSGANPIQAMTRGATVEAWLSAYEEEAATNGRHQDFLAALPELLEGTGIPLPKGCQMAVANAWASKTAKSTAEPLDAEDQAAALFLAKYGKSLTPPGEFKPGPDADLEDQAAALYLAKHGRVG